MNHLNPKSPLMKHIAKTTAGAPLRFSPIGYPQALFDKFLAAARADAALPAKSLARAEAALVPAEAWPGPPARQFPPAPPFRSLWLPSSAEKESDRSFEVDGPSMLAHAELARAFQADRVWLNAQAKTRQWLDADGMPLAFEAVFSRGLSLADGMRMDPADDASVYGSQSAFALFCPGPGGYLETIGSQFRQGSPICRARLFESSAAARQYASRKKIAKEVSVVEVGIRALRMVTLAEKGDHAKLAAAIAQAEAMELDLLLRAREVAELRDKVERLEALSPAPPAARAGRL